jgi:hypothetical protein
MPEQALTFASPVAAAVFIVLMVRVPLPAGSTSLVVVVTHVPAILAPVRGALSPAAVILVLA